VAATLYCFGCKRGVTMDTMSEFFVRLRLETQVGCSPSALRGVMQALEAALVVSIMMNRDGDNALREAFQAMAGKSREGSIVILLPVRG
jgi:hypothetical protein